MKSDQHRSFLFASLWVRLFLLCISVVPAWPFCARPLALWRETSGSSFSHDRIRRSASLLYMSGMGIATNYTWKEEAYELDVTVQVPAFTRAKDIFFRATSRSIDLRLLPKTRPSQAQQSEDDNDQNEIVLLDKVRLLRGRINLDGTYWVISDNDSDTSTREVTVTIEKLTATPKDDFEVIDYDWKGVFADEYDGEIVERRYDGPEPLDVREYAASLGVDIDNLDMSKVDKTMFGNNLNMTHKSLDGLRNAGYLSSDEVTRQADGSEYTTDDEGNAVQIQPPQQQQQQQQQNRNKPDPVPFLDTDSPWNRVNETVAQRTRNFTRAAFAEDSAQSEAFEQANPFATKQKRRGSKNAAAAPDAAAARDPIELLTVEKLKEILRSQGLKVSGSKKELQERLRSQVNSLMQGNEGQDAD